MLNIDGFAKNITLINMINTRLFKHFADITVNYVD